MPCLPDTFAAKAGSTRCTPCAEGKHSAEAAAICHGYDTNTPTKMPTAGTPPPTPLHGQPGVHAHLKLEGVSAQDIIDHQGALSARLDALNLGASYTSKFLGARDASDTDPCHRVTLAGLTADMHNGKYMGDYIKVSADVYRSVHNQAYLYKHHTPEHGIRWLVGHDYRGDSAVLLAQTDDVANPEAEWYSYMYQEGFSFQESWHLVAVHAKCQAAPDAIAHFLFKETDCLAAGDAGAADEHAIKNALLAGLTTTQNRDMLDGLAQDGLHVKQIAITEGILVSCAPVIDLVVRDEQASHVTCTYKDGTTTIDHKPEGAGDYHCAYHNDRGTNMRKCLCRPVHEKFSFSGNANQRSAPSV